MDKIYAVIHETEDLDFSEIDLVEKMIDGAVSYFRNLFDLMAHNEEDEDISECKIFVLTIGSTGVIKNNPKFVTLEELNPPKKTKK